LEDRSLTPVGRGDQPDPSRFYWRGRPGDLDAELTWENASRYDRRAELVATERLTDTGTVRLSFRVTDDQSFAFSPGQWIGLEQEVPGVGLRSSSYCILSPPGDDGRFEVLLRVLADGPLSHHLASLPAGYMVRFRGPRGRSLLPKASDARLVALATGVGIAPLYSLFRHLSSLGEPRPVRLYWGLRLSDDICLLDELNELVGRLPDFSYRISLSQSSDWRHLNGRVTESVPPLLETLGGSRFYLSGNGAMVEEMALALSSLGVDRTFIAEERFFNLRHQPDRATMDAIRERFVADDLATADTRPRGQVWRQAGPGTGRTGQ
jgi:ferredoxin-NADP reductase